MDSLVVVGAVAALAFVALAAVPRFRRPALVSVGGPAALLVGLVAAFVAGALSLRAALVPAVALSFVGSSATVLATSSGRVAVRQIRSRLLFGLPWGTLLVVAFVAGFYLFVQFGASDPYAPLVVPFVSWSYFYPVGVVTAPFAHASLGHVTGNLVGTLALAPVAEYAFSHFPTARGESTFSSWRTNPYVRALVLFPFGVAGVSLLTGAFAWGATIGFSGVVFAFAGFALVRFPLATVVALTAREVLYLLWNALRDPIVFASASPSYAPPWWAGIAVQGHLFGFLVGAVLAAVVVARRDEGPSPVRVWFGALVLTAAMSLWALWWYGTTAQYVLFRGVGVLLVVAVALLLSWVVGANDAAVVSDLSARRVATALLVLPVVTMAIVAVPVNLTTVQHADLPGDPVEVGGYQVTYAEGVQNERVAAVDVPFFQQATNVTASGVIVANEDRHIWTEEVSAGELGFRGWAVVRVGGVGWQTTVRVQRSGLVPDGGDPVYNVYLQREGDRWRHVYASEPSTADAVLAGKRVRVAASGGTFALELVRNGSVVADAAVPERNASVTLADVRFVHNGSRVVAHVRNTSVTVARQETYE